MDQEPQYIIRETSNSGQSLTTYVLSTSKRRKTDSNKKQDASTRIDTLPQSISGASSSTSSSGGSALSLFTRLTTYLAALFLPTGYPHTVTPDYTPYQIYDSLQAFASTIASLLSSRAVLQSLNLASSSSNTETATYATLLSIAQSTVANLSTILFAQYAAPRISSEVKFYRFLADIVNDLAFVLDCLSPSLPPTITFPILSATSAEIIGLSPVRLTLPVRMLTLCLSSALRAVCGVAGGSSKAVLSSHFAKDEPSNIGELNAKDGSQETVVNLIGMWIGGVLVSRVDGIQATWCWMLALLGAHLWFNYCAVRSVRLRGLNKTRAAMVLSCLVNEVGSDVDQPGKGGQKRSISVDTIGRNERVLFGQRNVLIFDNQGCAYGKCKIGVSLLEFVQSLGGYTESASGSLICDAYGTTLPGILDHFKNEKYLISFDPRTKCAIVMLKKNASAVDQLKSQYHCIKLGKMCEKEMDGVNMKSLLSESLEWVNGNWDRSCAVLKEEGWDLGSTSLEQASSNRVDIESSGVSS